MGSSECLVWIAEQPQRQGGPGATDNVLVLAIPKSQGAVLRRLVERHRLFEVGLRRGEGSQEGQGLPQPPMGKEEQRRIVPTLGQTEELFTQFVPCVPRGPGQVKIT